MKIKYYLSGSVICIGLAVVSYGVIEVNPCYGTRFKNCYRAGDCLLDEDPVSCYGYTCYTKSYYITTGISGWECYELAVSTGTPTTGRTNCIDSTLDYLTNQRIVKRSCNALLGCYTAYVDTNSIIVSCDDDHLDNQSGECNPAK